MVTPGSKNEVVRPGAFKYNSEAVTAEGRVITVRSRQTCVSTVTIFTEVEGTTH